MKKVSGDPLEISFNPDYMKDALRAFGDMSIKIQFISAIRPFTLEPSEGRCLLYSINYTSTKQKLENLASFTSF